jgi:hypothetical protein
MASKDKRSGSVSADGTNLDGPYQGKAGASRLENVHVPLADGRVRSVAIYRAINVATDPHLREAALGGALHRFETGEELAISFVYHDPSARKFCVVVPESLRHEELKERARLLERIAEDADHPVPHYVREGTSVVGVLGLDTYLARPASRSVHDLDRREQELESREKSLASRDEVLSQREVRIRERAEDVTGREDELRQQAEENEAMARDLAMRESELEERMLTLTDRERALKEKERAALTEPTRLPEPRAAAPEPREETTAPKIVLAAVAPAIAPAKAAPKSTPPPAAFRAERTEPVAMRAPLPIVSPAIVEDVSDEVEEADDVEELEDIEPLGTQPGRARADEPEELVDPDEVAEEVDPDALSAREEVTGVHGRGDEDGEPKTMIATASSLSPKATGGRAMPDALGRGGQMTVAIEEPIELTVRLLGEPTGELELLAQLATDAGAPIVVLTLTTGPVPSGQPDPSRRVGLDPRVPDDRRVLEILRRRFEARVHLFGADGAFLRTTTVKASREVNVARMLDRAARLRTEATALPDAAKERALASPPPLSSSHPFGGEPEGTDAASAARALGEVAEWMAPEKLEQALLEISVPADTVDAVVAKVVERAVAHGLALPSALADRAVAAGIAPEQGALVGRQIDAFRKTVSQADRGGLDDSTVASNWERLLAAAADHEVAIDSETHELAYRTIRAVRGDTTGGHALGTVDPASFVEMGPPELVVMLDHPRFRRQAAIALAGRGDAQFADALCKAVRKMPRAEVVRVVPKITKLGEEAGDALIDGLTARKTFVRQAFALALGHLKLRRAVVPLLHLLTSEESDVWREVARVLGTFGNASFRTLQRQLSDVKAGEDRYIRTLAYLANNGCEKSIAELTKDSDAKVASLATRALAMREDVRIEDERVHGKRALEGADPWLAFSRRFFEELDGTAPDVDLLEA